MKFLLYSEVPNGHRNPIFLGIAKTLIALSNEVRVVCERKIAIKLSSETPLQIGDHSKFISSSFSKLPDESAFVIDTFSGTTDENIREANDLRCKKLKTHLEVFSPDYIILWNGSYSFQEGTLRAIEDSGLFHRILYCEVAWFSQKEFIYFDRVGVNYKSSIPNKKYSELLPAQKQLMAMWTERYVASRTGIAKKVNKKPMIFVPLQVDTDSSIKLGSPFLDMQGFITFLESWIPEGYNVILKGHPKAKYPYVLHTNRRDFLVIFSGNIDNYIADADYIIGINSTVLLEGAVLGKKVISFGKGLFTGTSIFSEATLDSCAEQILSEDINKSARDSFFYHLLFERQICIEKLSTGDTGHLLSRYPFNEILANQITPSTQLVSTATEGKSMLRIGKSKIAKTASLDCENGGTIIIGDRCEVRHHAVMEVSGSHNGTIEIGNDSVIGVGNWIQGSGQVTIGNHVIIGPYVAIVSTNHQYQDPSLIIAQQPLTRGKVVIEDDVWIGAHCTISYNVTIGAHSIIAANSFVNKDVPPYSIVGGAPARLLKSRI